jgi:hypothetical protein
VAGQPLPLPPIVLVTNSANICAFGAATVRRCGQFEPANTIARKGAKPPRKQVRCSLRLCVFACQLVCFTAFKGAVAYEWKGRSVTSPKPHAGRIFCILMQGTLAPDSSTCSVPPSSV